MKRGDVLWADLGLPRGSAPALRRPMLVVSADDCNRSLLHSGIARALAISVR